MITLNNLVFDMDGVLWLGMTPMPDLPGFFADLDALGLRYLFATNNASRTVEQYIEKFAKFGVAVEPWQILSSAETTGAVLAEQYAPGTRVYVVGGDGLRSALSTRGFELVDLPPADDLADGVAILAKIEPVDIVVVGFFPGCNYGHLAAATHFVNKGGRFIGSNPDLSYPTEIGTFPGAGAIIKLVEVASDVVPTIIGKPFPYIFQEALKRLDAKPENTLMVGDRLNTDIRGAIDVGMRTALVLSGISTEEDVAASDFQPDFVFAHIGEMLEALKARA